MAQIPGAMPIPTQSGCRANRSAPSPRGRAAAPTHGRLLSGVRGDAEAAKSCASRPCASWSGCGSGRQTLTSGLPELRSRLAAEQESERRARAEKLRAEARQALANRERALRRFGACTRDAVSAAREVERHRELVDASVDALRPLADDEELGLDLDETTWADGSDELVAVLRAGPRRPRAERERKREEAAGAAERQDAERLAWLKRHPSETNLKLLRAVAEGREATRV